MSPRTEQQYEAIRQEKSQLIMDTALELFASNTYERTTISQIAHKADISKGLLYNYFNSKEELLKAILNKGIDDLQEVFDPNKDGVLESHELAFFIVEFFHQIKEKREFWKLYWSVSFQPSAFKLTQDRLSKLYEVITKMMTEYFRKMGFKNPEAETLIFVAILDGVTLDYIVAPEEYPLQTISQELIDRYCNQKTNES